MKNTTLKDKLNWQNPREKLWGVHVHQELPKEEFAKALVIQQKTAEFLEKHRIAITAQDAFKPGYGPHLAYMWELRVEEKADNVLEQLGLALSFLAVNRFGLSGYIHPLTHDDTVEDDLETEGRDNQNNTLWFDYRVKQNLDFFFHPPRDADNKLIDTRTPKVMSDAEKQAFLKEGEALLKSEDFLDPFVEIKNGFHIHMDYTLEEETTAKEVFERFVAYLKQESITPTSADFYAPKENGPHIQGGWEVKFETADPKVFTHIGIAMAWLMVNRQNLPVFLHPVTWEEGDHESEYHAHDAYAMFIGDLPPLDLTFFTDKI